ncbi:putative cyclin-dependent kinase F-2 [Lolium rigidum]|uniref:putative cyclin-dependent kinase F-2 n=1 Tax=Lolium rigidum TaxID=89674 RepID=UPI001F5CA705|nr:putative cyclin-dependent kinase F-2 [Lolium rigidum]
MPLAAVVATATPPEAAVSRRFCSICFTSVQDGNQARLHRGCRLAVNERCGAPELTICKRSRLWSSDDYEETRELGQGASGGVVEARLRCTGTTFALKKPLRCKHEDDGISCACSDGHMLQEAAFLAKCHGHPALVELQAIALDAIVGGKLSIVMDCVGPSLYDVLHQHRHSRPFTEPQVRCIMPELLAGAKHMHRRRVVHRDIKLENILVGPGGIEEDVKHCEPPPYGRRGTYGYMAPEVLLGQTDYDAMADMWSLGCVMAELLTGEPLFYADDDAEALLDIFRVLGVPLFTTWPAYKSLPLAGKLVTPPHVIARNKLRDHFPEDLLSEQGFEVLKGLLSCNIDRRLSATTALRRPWFSNCADPSA